MLFRSHNVRGVYGLTDNKVFDKEAERAKLEKLIKDSKAQLDRLSETNAKRFKEFEKELKAMYPKVQEFLDNTKKGIKLSLEHLAAENKVVKEEVGMIAEKVYQAFHKTMIENGN